MKLMLTEKEAEQLGRTPQGDIDRVSVLRCLDDRRNALSENPSLKAEVARLRKALQEILDTMPPVLHLPLNIEIKEIAEAALRDTPDTGAKEE